MQHGHTTYFGKRESGISLIGDLSWGSHFCQFYQTGEDLLEVLVPYLRAGLENNEFCVWVTDSPFEVETATSALQKAIPCFQESVRKGQAEIIPRDQWHMGNGQSASALVSRLDKAIARGFDGLRLACNTLPEETDGYCARDAVDAICRYNAIALFAYPRDRFDAIGLMAIMKNHRFALVRNAGTWQIIESSEAQTVQDALRLSEEKLHSVFANMSEGFGYHRIVLDSRGLPYDYVFLEVNEAFERLTGLEAKNLIGKRATEALPGIEKDPADWIGIYGKVALTGTPAQFESYSQSLRRWYAVSAFSPHKGFFAVTFGDITERKAAEAAMRDANERLQSQAEELQAQAEELNVQAEELRAANEGLHRSEQALRISEQRVRMKLDSILSPGGDLGDLELADIIDGQAIQSLVEDFYRLARIPLSIIDLKGRVLVGVGWQEICTKYHRVHPRTCRHCVESDTELSAGIAPGECRRYKCKNNLWDIATPLLVGGKHVGNLFSGQFFFEDEPVDRELFRSQARRYGFDEQQYLAALDAVPRLSREAVDTGIAFFMKLARMLSQLSYSNIQLARSLGERDRLMASLRQSQDRLNRAQEIARLGSWELDLTTGVLTWSDEVYRIFGLAPQEFAATYEAFLDAVHPDDRRAVDEAYSSSLREGRDSYEIEHRIMRKSTGEIRIVHEKCEHTRAASGRIIRSTGMVHDITERKEAQRALQRSEERFKLLSETAGRLLAEENPQGIVNDLCHKVMEHLDCQAFFNFLVDEQAGRLRLNAYAGISDEEARKIEWLDSGVAVCGCVARDGVRIVAEDIPAHPDPRTDLVASYGIRAYACHPLLAEGRVLGTLSFGTRTRSHFSADDLSLMKTVVDQVAVAIERIQAQRALRESEAQLQAVVENLDEGVVVADLEGRLLHWNRAALEMHGFASLNECRRRLPDLAGTFELSDLDGTVLPVEQWPLAHILRGEALRDWEVQVRRLDDGTQRIFNYGGLLVRDAQGQPFMAVVTVGDITERKRAEAEREHHLDLHVKLVRITQDILDAADLPDILQKVADASVELTDARLGASGHGFADGKPHVRAVSRGAGAPTCQMAGGFALVQGGVHLDLLRAGESVCLTDEQLRAHPAWWGLPEGHMPLRGLLGARLVDADGRPNGLIMVSDKADGGEFTAEDEIILRQLASIASLAIRLIEARDEAQQRAREAIAAGTALRDGAERLELALESGRMGRWEWDLETDASFWDPRLYELLGLDASAPAAGHLLLALVDGRDRASLQGVLQSAAGIGGDFQTEFRIVRFDGEIVWLTLCAKVILHESGRGGRMFGVLYDITQRKQMEDQLRRLNDELEEEVQAQTEELRDTVDRLQDEITRRVGAEVKLRKHAQMLEGFFQHTMAPLAFMDRDFNFIRVNEAYATAGGETPEYFVGKNHFILHPHDENRTIFEQVVQTRQLYRAYAKPFTYLGTPHRGTTFWNMQLTPLLDERGEVQFLVLNLEDVTERQRAFQELQRRARQLQHLTLELSQAEDRERRRLAEILHDDLQQQLAAAKFHLGILGGRIKDNVSVRGMVGQLDQILKDAIDKSRSLSHELSPAVLYHSDLGETLEWLARQVQAKHGLTVHVDAEERLHVQSEALKVFLYRAAQEILFNIVKHARVREARLRLKRMNGNLWLTIADRGQGFDPQTLGRTGGFGLFSIRERIELLGGRMRVRSVQGRGSVFVIVMPDGQMTGDGEPQTEAGLIPSSVVRPVSSSPRLRVLLADDHKVMREGLAALLNEQVDMEVVAQAGNGREAVNLACTLQPDVVIMDIAMPLMTGDEATRQIKLHMPNIRVIALSMFEEAGVAETVRAAGAERYLLKTAPFDELLSAIRGKPL